MGDLSVDVSDYPSYIWQFAALDLNASRNFLHIYYTYGP